MSLHRLPSASMFQHDAAASCGQQESKIEHFCCSSKATPCSVCDRKHIEQTYLPVRRRELLPRQSVRTGVVGRREREAFPQKPHTSTGPPL